jgi:hypothetical protein
MLNFVPISVNSLNFLYLLSVINIKALFFLINTTLFDKFTERKLRLEQDFLETEPHRVTALALTPPIEPPKIRERQSKLSEINI